ncbi:MAG: ATP-binding cassette domain-containing protein [Planctomycetota bacterium]
MSELFIRFNDVAFRYDSASMYLLEHVSLYIGRGFSGVVGSNGAGKTTFLKLATGLLQPNRGDIRLVENSVYCSQRTDEMPDKLVELIASNTKSARITKSRLGVEDDWCDRWETLSHGERKRAQIAVAFWLEPALLAIDEPTNHIDSQARETIRRALSCFKGIGLLVSHDRELLDLLCCQCLFVEPPRIIVRPGGITKGIEIAEAEQKSKKRQLVKKKNEYKLLKREFSRRGELARHARKRVSKKRLTRKDSDGREKRDRARVSGKDGVGGKLQKQIQKRVQRARQRLTDIDVKKEYELGIWLPGCCSKWDMLLQLRAGMLPLGEERRLHYPELVIAPSDRIGLKGPNGSGKTSLIRRIIKSLRLSKERVIYIPQEIDIKESRNILADARSLSGDKLGHLLAIVRRLGSNPEHLLNSNSPSPGETRKLLLAIGMTNIPYIVVMDEPTNHMDLESIRCLEKALSDCPCSLILVSHDKYFLEKLSQKFWNITEGPNSRKTLTLQVE